MSWNGAFRRCGVVVKTEMIRLASKLPEYETVYSIFVVGDVTVAQFVAEIGHDRNCPRRSSLVGFASVNPEVNQSGKTNSGGAPSARRGSPSSFITISAFAAAWISSLVLLDDVSKTIDIDV